jgi:hypothetical protein
LANFTGFSAHALDKFSSIQEQDDPTNLPLGVAAVARNVTYRLTGVRTRWGIGQTLGNVAVGFNTGTGKPVTGLQSFKYNGNGVTADKQVPLVYDQQGNMFIESPAGSGTLVPVAPAKNSDGNNLISLPAGYLQAAQTLNRGYLAFTDLTKSTGLPAAYDLNTGILDPASMKLFGFKWTAGTAVSVGEVVSPTSVAGNGHLYRCTTAGTTGAVEPVWPLTDSSTINDNGVIWTEYTPVLAQSLQNVINVAPSIVKSAGSGTFAAARDVYIALTLQNGNGETLLGNIFVSLNTTLNDRFVVSPPVLPAWVTALTGANVPIAYKIYEADVPTGNAAPIASAFKLASSSLLANPFNVDTTAGGAAPPVADLSFIVPAGNICAGQRYAVTLFVNRNGYITGMTQASVVGINVAANGSQLYMANVAIGPANTKQRIVAFGIAGGTNVGPFAYIPTTDSVNGIQMTSTVINDNTTTTATFNFTDIYLTLQMATTTNVTGFFDKIQIPNCVGCYFSPTLNRMIWFPDALPSGFYISPVRDPETIFGSTGILQVSENDREKRMGWVDFKSVQYVLKEKSGHEVTVSSVNPSQWTSRRRWTGMGPCGLRAFDVGPDFIAFAHRSGAYVFRGDTPQWVSKELSITWKRINWAAASTIWVTIDDETKEVRFGVPLGLATVPSHILKLNYEESLEMDPPVHSSIYSRGKFVSSAGARKWSIDTIAANSCIRAERTLLNLPVDGSFDQQTAQSQVLFASSNPDGAVAGVLPGVLADLTPTVSVGIDSVYEGVPPGEALKILQLGGVQVNCGGSGAIGISLLSQNNKATADGGNNTLATEKILKDLIAPNIAYVAQASGQAERWRLRVSNKGVPGAGFDLKSAIIWARPLFQSRTK